MGLNIYIYIYHAKTDHIFIVIYYITWFVSLRKGQNTVRQEHQTVFVSILSILLLISGYFCTEAKNLNKFYHNPLPSRLIWTQYVFNEAIQTPNMPAIAAKIFRRRQNSYRGISSAVTFLMLFANFNRYAKRDIARGVFSFSVLLAGTLLQFLRRLYRMQTETSFHSRR